MNRAIMQQALDALVDLVPDPETDFGPMYEYAKKQQKLAIQALKVELTKPEPEPIGWLAEGTWDFYPDEHPDDGGEYEPLFTKEQL